MATEQHSPPAQGRLAQGRHRICDICRTSTSSVDLSQFRFFQRARAARVLFALSFRRRVMAGKARSIESIGTKSQGGMSCGMLWLFSRQSCCFARHWMTPSPGAVVAAALEAEGVASMAAGAFMAGVDITLRDVLTRATRSRVVRVTVARVTRVARSRDGRATIPEPPGEPRR